MAVAEEAQSLATVRLDPPDAADGANWFYILAWAGGADRVIDKLERVVLLRPARSE